MLAHVHCDHSVPRQESFSSIRRHLEEFLGWHMGASKTTCVHKELMYLTKRLPPWLVMVTGISARPLYTWNEHHPSSTDEEWRNSTIGSFKVSGSAADEAKTGTQLLPVRCTCRYVLGSEWRERLFRKHHGEGDKAARSEVFCWNSIISALKSELQYYVSEFSKFCNDFSHDVM